MKYLLVPFPLLLLCILAWNVPAPPTRWDWITPLLNRTGLIQSGRTSNERSPSTSLKTISSAQADFRANDRDGDRVHQYWRGDISGLYAVIPREGTIPVKLIELGLAAADDRPATQDILKYAVRSSKAGYWYQALGHSDETTPDPNRFAACCFPAAYPSTGTWTYIIDENNTIFRADLGHGRGIDVFPDAATLKKEWSKLD